MTQLQILTYRGASQIEIAVFHADIVTTIGIVLYCEWRSDALAEDFELADNDFYIARGQIGILAMTLTDSSFRLNTELTSQLISPLTESGVNFIVKNQLGKSVTVAQINKRHTAHFSSALHPSGQCHLFAGI